MYDVLLTLAVCVTQVVLGLMGIQVSLNPPSKDHHRQWMVAFVLVGAVGVFLTGWLSKRNADTQNALKSQLDRIEHNPPKIEVNVPPSVPPQIIVNPNIPTKPETDVSRGFM